MMARNIGDGCPCCGSGIMQYCALVGESKGGPVERTIAAPECSAVMGEVRGDIKVRQVDFDNSPDYVVYGAFIPNKGMDEEEMTKELVFLVGKWVGTLVSDAATLYVSATGDIKAYPSNGRLVPFAAVLCTELPIRDLEAPALTLFIRYADADPVANVLMRKGLMAVKTGDP